MNEKDFAVLCELRDRIHAMERRYPNNRRVKELHAFGWRALCKLKGALRLTDEQFVTLGGGTDKPPPDED